MVKRLGSPRSTVGMVVCSACPLPFVWAVICFECLPLAALLDQGALRNGPLVKARVDLLDSGVQGDAKLRIGKAELAVRRWHPLWSRSTGRAYRYNSAAHC